MRGIIAGLVMLTGTFILFINLIDLAVYNSYVKTDKDIVYSLNIPLMFFFSAILIEKRTFLKCNMECKQYNSAFWGLILTITLTLITYII